MYAMLRKLIRLRKIVFARICAHQKLARRHMHQLKGKGGIKDDVIARHIP